MFFLLKSQLFDWTCRRIIFYDIMKKIISKCVVYSGSQSCPINGGVDKCVAWPAIEVDCPAAPYPVL